MESFLGLLTFIQIESAPISKGRGCPIRLRALNVRVFDYCSLIDPWFRGWGKTLERLNFNSQMDSSFIPSRVPEGGAATV